MKAKVLVQSPNISTYANIVTAICNQYPDTEKIVFSFLNESDDTNFIQKIREKLNQLSHNFEMYKITTEVALSCEKNNKNEKLIITGFDIVDVTSVSKEIAIDVAASAITDKNVKICILVFNKPLQNNEQWIIEKKNYSYQNLLSQGSLKKLYNNYFQKKYIVLMFTVMFVILVVVAIIKLLIPDFIIPIDYISVFSLIIGAAGLYLTSVSLKSSNP